MLIPRSILPQLSLDTAKTTNKNKRRIQTKSEEGKRRKETA
jgi:hypothetical protein